MRRAVILAAGKSTRLGGENKLLVEAGGVPVHEWHERLLRDIPTTIITRPEDVTAVADAASWAKVIPHDKYDGPVGALAAYLQIYLDRADELIVLFADTLLVPQPLPERSWVGVAPAPARTWDLYAPWGWTRGVPYIPVCVGIYSFDYPDRLRRAVKRATEHSEGKDLPMIELLNEYAKSTPLRDNPVRGWHDAGDTDAIRRVPNFEGALLEDPTRLETVGWLDVALTR